MLAGIADAAALATLLPARSRAPRKRDIDGAYRFDIRLQGPGETVFFDV